MEVRDLISKDACAKFQAALKKKNFKELYFAQAMMAVPQTNFSTANTGILQTREQQKSTRKKSIINTFLSQFSNPDFKKS